jgi:branched-chain amino acid aminotransferase
MDDAHSINPRDRGFLLGDGVFDTALIENGRIPFRERHLARLLRAAEHISLSLSGEQIKVGWDAALAGRNERHILRTSLSRGVASRGLWPEALPEPTLSLTLTPFDPSLRGRPVKLGLSSLRRNETSLTSRLKTLSSLDVVLAARDAREKGHDDALFCNTKGFLTCSTLANLFLIRGLELLTPPLCDGVLDGIIRAVLLERAPSCGLVPREISLLPEDMYSADSIFLTNSLRLVCPVTHWEDEMLAQDERLLHRLTACLRE